MVQIIHEYTKFAGAYGLIAGQVVDIESEGGKYIKSPEETLDFIHLNKTAVLFRLAVRCGAIIANASKDTAEEMDVFAKNFGLAFQIYDDIMDEISTFEEMGKTLGKDKEEGKLTYTSLYGLDKSKEDLNKLLDKCFEILSINNLKSEVFEQILNKIRIN